jgi:hypothetical protein
MACSNIFLNFNSYNRTKCDIEDHNDVPKRFIHVSRSPSYSSNWWCLFAQQAQDKSSFAFLLCDSLLHSSQSSLNFSNLSLSVGDGFSGILEVQLNILDTLMKRICCIQNLSLKMITKSLIFIPFQCTTSVGFFFCVTSISFQDMIKLDKKCIYMWKTLNSLKLKETMYLTVPKWINIAYQLVWAELARMWCSEYRGSKLSHDKPGYIWWILVGIPNNINSQILVLIVWQQGTR